MPHADPASSFEAAARHLFRHINDVKALRWNPLVRSFFGGEETHEENAVVLREIHARILMEASALCGEHAVGSSTRARRQRAIVHALCAGESAADTAARVGVSIHHYYRERHIICTRVSRALLQATPEREIEVGDTLGLLLTRAAVLQDQGFARKAVSVLEEASSCVVEGDAKSTVRLELARALISLGQTARAAKLLTEFSGPDDPRAGDLSNRWLRDRYVLTEALLATEIGLDADAGRALETLAQCRIADRRADEAALDTLIECGNWYFQNGKFGQARHMLRQARDLNGRLRHVAAHRQIGIALLAAYCAEDSFDEFGLQHYWLREALALSISNGSASGMLKATSGLMGYYASIGCDDEAYFLAKDALGIAQATEGTRILANAGVEIVAILSRTRYWRAVDPLLFEVERLVQPSSLWWAVLKHLQGGFLTRTGRYDRAENLLVEAYELAREMKNEKLEGVVLRDLALARRHAGSSSESIEFMRRAVELAEQHSSAWSRSVTYQAAKRLLTDRRIGRLAQQAEAALSARGDKLGGVVRSRMERLTVGPRSPLTLS